MRSTRLLARLLRRPARFDSAMYESRIGSSILLVTIIHATPSEAVMPSSRTMSIGISMITAKPSTLVRSASVPGMKSLANERSRRREAVAPATTSRSTGLGHLHRVRHADREDQERHQDRQRVDAEAQQRQRAQQPQHRHHRHHERHQRELHVLHEPQHQRQRDHERHAEESDHAARAVADVADRLGEPDDVHAVSSLPYLARSSSSCSATWRSS